MKTFLSGQLPQAVESITVVPCEEDDHNTDEGVVRLCPRMREVDGLKARRRQAGIVQTSDAHFEHSFQDTRGALGVGWTSRAGVRDFCQNKDHV